MLGSDLRGKVNALRGDRGPEAYKLSISRFESLQVLIAARHECAVSIPCPRIPSSLAEPQILAQGTSAPFFENRFRCLARSLHTLANGGRGFTYPVIAELFVIHPGDVDVDINSIEQGTRDSLLIFRDDSGRTWIGLDRIPTITTGAGIHTLGHMIRVLTKVIKWV